MKLSMLSITSQRATMLGLIVALTLSGSVRNIHAQSDDHDHNDRPLDHDDQYDHESEEGDDHSGEGHGDDGSSRLSPQDVVDFGIQLQVAGPGVIREELRLPGEIRVNENTTAHVGPRFAGVVTAIQRRLGDQVHPGELLATMETNDTLRPFDLKAPTDGTIVEFHITLGESIDAGEYAFVLADTSTVWADLNVYQRDLRRIRNGQRVAISAGHGFDLVTGEIAYVGPVVNELTRTGLARVVLDNPDGVFRPGLFVVADVVLGENAFPVVVPLSALQTVNGEEIVYVEPAEGEGFVPRIVTIGHRDSHHAEIRYGLEAGEFYVSAGGFFLKADAQKEDFGDGHDH